MLRAVGLVRYVSHSYRLYHQKDDADRPRAKKKQTSQFSLNHRHRVGSISKNSTFWKSDEEVQQQEIRVSEDNRLTLRSIVRSLVLRRALFYPSNRRRRGKNFTRKEMTSSLYLRTARASWRKFFSFLPEAATRICSAGQTNRPPASISSTSSLPLLRFSNGRNHAANADAD